MNTHDDMPDPERPDAEEEFDRAPADEDGRTQEPDAEDTEQPHDRQPGQAPLTSRSALRVTEVEPQPDLEPKAES